MVSMAVSTAAYPRCILLQCVIMSFAVVWSDMDKSSCHPGENYSAGSCMDSSNSPSSGPPSGGDSFAGYESSKEGGVIEIKAKECGFCSSMTHVSDGPTVIHVIVEPGY